MKIVHTKPDPSKIPAFFEPTINFQLEPRGNNVLHFTRSAFEIIGNFLDRKEVSNLIELFDNAPVREAVSIQGLKDVPSDKGSDRTTMWSEELAEMFFERLKDTDFIRGYLSNEYSRTDAWQHLDFGGEDDLIDHKWECIGFSPLLRFMSYTSGGQHYAHYDAGFIYPDTNIRTLKSVVIYLTTNDSGTTRFIEDGQNLLKQSERVNLDWANETPKDMVNNQVYPFAGNILIFDHRLCHDVSIFTPSFEGERRMIIRGDLIYKRVK